jgi:hypothetical protein
MLQTSSQTIKGCMRRLPAGGTMLVLPIARPNVFHHYQYTGTEKK